MKYQKKPSRSIRYLLGFACLCLLAGVVWVSGMHTPTGAASESVVARLDTSVFDSASGGDVTVPPPQVVLPALPHLDGALVDAEALSAAAVIVKDRESGAVLYAKNEYDERSLASISKLMSALVILEYGPDWNAVVPVASDDISDTHMYAGETYTMEALWRAALIGSSNKAIVSLVDGLGVPRDAFVARMNAKALELGMTNTTFVEPTGLDVRNVSTAADVALLLDEAMKVNEIRQTLELPEYMLVSVDRTERHHIWSTNWLLLHWIDNQLYDLRGGKTGYIPAAGYNFAMQVGDVDGHVVNVVVLGTDSHEARFTEARDVAVSVFDNYAWPVSAVAGEKIAN